MRSADRPKHLGGSKCPSPKNLKFTRLTQNLGQLKGSYRDFQSNCWINLRILGQACEFYLTMLSPILWAHTDCFCTLELAQAETESMTFRETRRGSVEEAAVVSIPAGVAGQPPLLLEEAATVHLSLHPMRKASSASTSSASPIPDEAVPVCLHLRLASTVRRRAST